MLGGVAGFSLNLGEVNIFVPGETVGNRADVLEILVSPYLLWRDS